MDVLAQWYSAQLTLFHVYQVPPPPAIEGIPPVLPLLVDADLAKIAEEIRSFCGPLLGRSGQRVDIIVRPGDPAREIRRESEQLPFDLLILGTHGRSGFERLFLGSVTEKVLRSTRVPVLTIPPPVHEPRPPLYKTILCPLEFSAASMKALEYALSLAQEADARLILLHAVEDILGDAHTHTVGHLNVSEYYKQLEQDAVTRLRAVVPDKARVWCRPEERVVMGRASREILRVVADERVDLVVMGVHGKGVVDHLLFGSTAHRVIRHAGCPVLTLHGGA